MFSLLLLAALASPKPLDPSDPESLVANIICGEAGNDDALGMLLIPVAIGPSGAVLSLDRRLGFATSGDEPSVAANIAVQALGSRLARHDR
jgi:hypothetical protein